MEARRTAKDAVYYIRKAVADSGDAITKSEEELLFFEEKLGLAKKLHDATEAASELKSMSFELDLPSDFQKKLDELISLIEK